MVDAYHVIRFKFIRHCAIADAGDHGRQRGALFDEIFLADRIVETLADGDVAEFHAVTSGVIDHAINFVVAVRSLSAVVFNFASDHAFEKQKATP